MLGFAASRKWVYAMPVDGSLRLLRRGTSLILLLILFVTPWITVAGHPALLLDLPSRRLFAFGAIFTASDTVLLLLILLFLAFCLFFFTALFGRLWCGYACPQTVFLEEFIRPLERWIEGSRGAWIHRDEAPWTIGKAVRKAAKWTLFGAAAAIVAVGFMSYFAGARELWTGQAGPTEYALVGIFGAIWFFDFTYFREQFCNFLCPYARFQSVMIDDQTLQITYDVPRGEPRGVPTARETGACIDCNKCVAVCPQGIDIRNGFQLECIACGACIDACNDVLGRLGHPGLMGYTSLVRAQGRAPRRVRPRTVAYASLLTGLAAAWVALVATRIPFEAAVNRAPGSLYTIDEDGFVRNTYLLQVTNNDARTESLNFHVQVEGLPDAEVLVQDLELGSTESQTVPLVVRVPGRDAVSRTLPIRVLVTSPTGHKSLEATFKTGAEVDDDRHTAGDAD